MPLVNEILLIAAVALGILGVIGCIIPVIPGPPISYIGVILLHFSKYADFSTRFLILYLLLAIGVTVLDYVFPVWGTRKFGGSKRGIWGATIGLLVGIFIFPPIGIIVGPFAGALIGEMTGGMNFDEALPSALGSLAGVMAGIVAKLIVSGLMMFYIGAAVIKAIGGIFV